MLTKEVGDRCATFWQCPMSECLAVIHKRNNSGGATSCHCLGSPSLLALPAIPFLTHILVCEPGMLRHFLYLYRTSHVTNPLWHCHHHHSACCDKARTSPGLKPEASVHPLWHDLDITRAGDTAITFHHSSEKKQIKIKKQTNKKQIVLWREINTHSNNSKKSSSAIVKREPENQTQQVLSTA